MVSGKGEAEWGSTAYDDTQDASHLYSFLCEQETSNEFIDKKG
jgi:hypothetical protein